MIPIFAGHTRKNNISSEDFNFSSNTLPTGWAVTRSGTTATTMTATAWTAAAANTARYLWFPLLDRYKLLSERSRVNKVIHKNFAPTATTGITASAGDGVVSIVADPTGNIADATLTAWGGIVTGTFAGLQNGNVVQLTGGTAGTTYQITGQLGNTNKHTWRLCVSSDASGTKGTTQLTGGATTNIVVDTADEWQELIVPNITPAASTAYCEITVNTGLTLYLIAAQCEENTQIGTPIVVGTAGSTATRNLDEIFYNNINTTTWWNQKNGAAVWVGNQLGLTNNNEQAYYGFNYSNGATDQIAMRMVTGDQFTEANYKVNNVDQLTDKIGKHLSDNSYLCGQIWRESNFLQAFSSHGMTALKDTSFTSQAQTLTKLYLGRYQQFFGYADSVIEAMFVLKGNVTLEQVGRRVLDDLASSSCLPMGFGRGCFGQSNAAYAYKNQTTSTYDNAGEVAALSALNGIYGTDVRNFCTNGAVGGQRLYKGVTMDSNYMLEDDGSLSDQTLNALEMFRAAGAARYVIITLNQGESNSGVSYQDWYDGFDILINAVWDRVSPDIIVGLENGGRRGDNASADAQYERWFDVNAALAAAYPNRVFVMPNSKVLALAGGGDVVHLSNTGYAEKETWSTRIGSKTDGQVVTGAVQGAEIVSVYRDGTDVYIVLQNPDGITDNTIASGTEAEGFVFEDDGTPLAWTTAPERQSATVWKGVLSGTPSGVETLNYCIGTGYGLDPAKLIRGDDDLSMPVQQFKGTLPYDVDQAVIAADVDDVSEHVGVGLVVNTGGATQILGDATTALGYLVHAGVRFDGIAIDQGQNISRAIIRMYQAKHPTYTTDPDGDWYAWDVDDAAAFSDGVNMPSTVTGTTATAPYVPASSGTLGWVEHDVTDIVQEIVDRVGWESGNAINFYAIAQAVDGGALDIWEDYSTTSAHPAQLVVSFDNMERIHIQGVNYNFGMNITTAQDINDYTRLMDKAVAMGLTELRIDIQVRDVVSESGGDDVYDWTYIDSIFAAAESRILSLLPVLHYFPDHWLPSDATPIDGQRYALHPDYIPNFVAFIETLDARHTMTAIQICNEVDSDNFFHLSAELTGASWTRATLYGEILDQVGNSTYTHSIVHAGLTGADHEFMEDILAYNVGYVGDFDIMAYHGYHYSPLDGSVLPFNDDSITLDMDGYYTGGQAGYYNYPKYGYNVRKFLTDNGGTQPIWITEYGYLVDGVSIYDVTEDEAIMHIGNGVSFFDTLGIAKTYYYSMENAPSETFGVWSDTKNRVAEYLESIEN